jgi:HlyD family secretion protein
MAESNPEAPRGAPGRGRVGIAAVLVAGVAAAGAVWLARRGPSSSDVLTLYGNIDVRQVDVAFNEGDRIVAMHVEEGDPVERGQLLAELDGSRLEHAMLEAAARVATQRAVVARFEHGSRPEEIERARAEVAAAEAELHDARLTLQRTEKLAGADVASQQKADDARAAYLGAEARLKAARESLRLAVEGPRSEDTEAARAQLRADENALELAQHRLADTKLYAPAAGTVLTRILEPGAVVLPNTPAYTLALADPVWVRAYVSESDLGRVFPGMQAEITSDSFPDRAYKGWVGFVSPTAEFTPKPVETPDLRTSLVYRTRIYAKNPDQTLRQGMPVTVRLRLDQEPPVPAPQPAAKAPASEAELGEVQPTTEPPRPESEAAPPEGASQASPTPTGTP